MADVPWFQRVPPADGESWVRREGRDVWMWDDKIRGWMRTATIAPHLTEAEWEWLYDHPDPAPPSL